MISRGPFQPQLSCDSVIFKLAGYDPSQSQHSKSKSVGYCRSDRAALQTQAFVCTCVYQPRDWTLLPTLYFTG